MIDDTTYRRALGLTDPERGGQSLLLGEICGALAHSHRIALPFGGVLLRRTLQELGKLTQDYIDGSCDAIYFGTPTIVDGAPLFTAEVPPGAPLTKESERSWVRAAVKASKRYGLRTIVCGLGSGDISVEERLEDLGGGALVVCEKRFLQFTDWVLVRTL